MQLRPYQREASQAALTALQQGGNPALQLATGTGKSLIIAGVAHHLHRNAGRTWVLSHAQQLIGQNAETFYRHTGVQGGVVCSGLNRAEYDRTVTFATIQSIVTPGLRGDLPEPHLIIVDEAHRVPHKTGEQGQYERLLSRYPQARRIAMTATPWRTDNGLIYGSGAGFWFDRLAYRYTVPEAVRDGWLSPLVGVETEEQLTLDEEPLGADFVMAEVAERQTAAWLKGVAESVARLAANRKHLAVYCPNLTAAARAAGAIARATGWTPGILSGGMAREARAEALDKFKSGQMRVLCSVDTITTGFDFPALDCIVCLRPTTASNLWVQIMGRGTRLSPGKTNCLLLDYVGNLQRLGGVDMLESFVRERTPHEPVLALPAPRREPRRVLPGVRTLAVLDPTSGEQARDGATLRVQVHAVNAAAIFTRRNLTQPVLLVQYACTTAEGARIDASAFITTETPNAEAEDFFARRALAVRLPSEARKLMWQLKGAAQPEYVTVRKSGKYWNTVAEHFSA
jgi:DNA repair protein RadD